MSQCKHEVTKLNIMCSLFTLGHLQEISSSSIAVSHACLPIGCLDFGEQTTKRSFVHVCVHGASANVYDRGGPPEEKLFEDLIRNQIMWGKAGWALPLATLSRVPLITHSEDNSSAKLSPTAVTLSSLRRFVFEKSQINWNNKPINFQWKQKRNLLCPQAQDLSTWCGDNLWSSNILPRHIDAGKGGLVFVCTYGKHFRGGLWIDLYFSLCAALRIIILHNLWLDTYAAYCQSRATRKHRRIRKKIVSRVTNKNLFRQPLFMMSLVRSLSVAVSMLLLVSFCRLFINIWWFHCAFFPLASLLVITSRSYQSSFRVCFFRYRTLAWVFCRSRK